MPHPEKFNAHALEILAADTRRVYESQHLHAHSTAAAREAITESRALMAEADAIIGRNRCRIDR